MNFLQFHTIAASRGDGLRPELKALLEQVALHPFGSDMIQSRPADRAVPLPEVAQPIRPAACVNAPRDSQR